MGRYAGFPVQKGKLHLDLHWRLYRKELKAENKIAVDRLTLGQRTASPDATKLPVKLALALLTDRRGKIDLDVPLSGRLDDPAFRVWPLVGQVVMNLLGKAATSPFTLLGKLVGSGAEELGFIDFAAGAADLDPAGVDKIQKLAKVLYERPALAIEIVPSLDPLADREVLAQAKLLETLKVRRLHELPATNQTPLARSAVTLTDADRQRLIPALYSETFVSLTNQPGVPGTPPVNTTHNFTWGTQTNTLAAPNPGAATAKSLAEMEAALLSKMNVTDDDLHQLLTDRASKVQTALLQQPEPPAAERLFITNPEIPQPDPAHPPKARVNLGLQ